MNTTKKNQTQKKAPIVGVNVEALLAKRDQIGAAVIKGALAKFEAQKAEKQEAEVLEYLATVQRNTAEAIERLRSSRAAERKAKHDLQVIAEAEQDFYQDADIDAYNAKMSMLRMMSQLMA